MLAVRSMDVRDHFEEWCNKVIDGEALPVLRSENENNAALGQANIFGGKRWLV